MKPRSVLIYGKQRSGKTTLAKRIAKQFGTYQVLDINDFMIPLGLTSLLKEIPDTLIIEGVNNSDDIITRVKATATGSHLIIDGKGHIPFTIKTPALIFVMANNVIPCDMLMAGRRFDIMKAERVNA